ncbi:PTC2 [Candida pseudojiufengensis]|uniref:PTC2 n=1 Tax=Candida pseudojiufengensis TaxID=497109 RepID=UPI002224E2C2|nr:PTC2 [Candida pseudojiufengensis]KAI5966804.1 PTC2 [Candida pseudojiufengensis]
MGQILSQPVTEKHSEEGQDKYLAYGLSSMQGWRVNMEDAHTTILNLSNIEKDEEDSNDSKKSQPNLKENDEEIDPKTKIDSNSNTQTELNNNNNSTNNDDNEHIAFFGVYDGHGGEKVAIFTGENLHTIIKDTKEFQKKDFIGALKQGFLNCDQAILNDFHMRDDESGCAATSVIITESKIYCGNAGDSRTIMSIDGFAKPLSFDHKPTNEGEKARITAAGGYVDLGRVNGNLALSRGIGDFDFKKTAALPAEEQIVTCYPDVIIHDIDFSKDEFIILACDGIWDCLSSQTCIEAVRRGIYQDKSLSLISEEIMDLCLAPTSDGSGIGCDNMSIIIVALLDYTKNETLQEWKNRIKSKIDSKEKPESFGGISVPYKDLKTSLYGEHESFKSFDHHDEHEPDNDDDEEDKTGISLKKLLASNAVTNENGVIYLDTSSAKTLLEHFNVQTNNNDQLEEIHGDDDDEDVEEERIEEIEEK